MKNPCYDLKRESVRLVSEDLTMSGAEPRPVRGRLCSRANEPGGPSQPGRFRGWPLVASLACLVALTLCCPANAAEKAEAPKKQPDVIYVPTPQKVVDKMLEMAEVKKGDVVYDLGCGDGRFVVTAAKKYGVKAIGFDINPERVKESIENVRTNKVAGLVTIKEADIFTLDLTEASVVTLYLLPELNVRLMPQLEKLKPGSRIVSHDFDMRGAKPMQVHQINVSGNRAEDEGEYGTDHTIYKWVVPWEKDKTTP